MDDHKERIKRVFVEALMLDMSPEELHDDDDLNAKFGLDSVGFLEVLTAMEDEFEIEIQDHTVTRHSTGTVRKLADLVERVRNE